jgi:hypothetical protein
MAKKDKKMDDVSGLFIPAGVLIGVGVGMAVNQTAAGTLIGLGLGFLAMAIFKLLKMQK